MELYKKAFGEDYRIGIRIPGYFEDQSYRNDTGPSFVYVQGHRILKICILPEDPQEREVEEGLRYTLMEMKTSPDDDYQEFVDVILESDSPEEFERVISDVSQIKKLLSN